MSDSKKSILLYPKEFFMAFINVFVLAFVGLRFVLLDSFILLFNYVSSKVDYTYKLTKELIKDDEAEEKEKIRKQKQQKFEERYNKLWFVRKQNEKLAAMHEALLVDLQNEGSERSATPRVFQYKAKNKDGKMETGVINGYSKLDVNTFLLQDSYTVYEIKSGKMIDFLYGETSIFAVKMSNKDLLFWLTQLSTYLKAGIPLVEGVKILNNQLQKKKKYNKALQSIVYELTMGQSFSSALEKQGSMFPALLINMIKAAEATGELEETLTDMANYYTELDKTRKQMVSAITYPSVILVFAIAVIAFILLYVIPDFVKIYQDSNAEITGLTLAIINLSDFLKANMMIIVLIIIVIGFVIFLCYRNVKAFRRSVQVLLMHMPLIGNIIKYNELTIFTKTFASLLSNNVFITDSMSLLSKITNNEIYKEIMNETIDNIVKGDKISTAFKDHWAVPDVAYYMIVTGESTGTLADMMQKVSNYYAEMHRSLITNLKSFIEPILIAFLAIVVGIIILAVIVPMFGLLNSFD